MTGDTPDWIQATSSPAQLLTFTTLTASQSYQADVSGYASLYIRVDTSVVNVPAVVQVTWYTDATLADPVQQQTFTTTPNPGGGQFIVVQTPVYAPWVFITNATANTVSLTLTQSSIVVPQPRVLDSTVPARLFQYTGAWTSGIATLLPAIDGGPVGYSCNGSQWFSCAAGAAGVVGYNFIDMFGTSREIGFASLGATSLAATGTVGMSQGVIQPIYIPNTSGGGTVFCYLTPAQL